MLIKRHNHKAAQKTTVVTRTAVIGVSVLLASGPLTAFASSSAERSHHLHPSVSSPELPDLASDIVRTNTGSSDQQWVHHLRGLLTELQADPTSSAEFLTTLGPEGLIDLTFALGTTDADARADAAAVQSGLGEILATATTRIGDTGNVTHNWTDELQRVSREQRTLSVHGINVRARGYTALGILLGHSTYSSEFLNTIGGDILQLEQTTPHTGTRFWVPYTKSNTIPTALLTKIDLDLTGSLGTPAASWDPVTGFMTAISRNPATAQNFFLEETSEYAPQEQEDMGGGNLSGPRLDRVGYLLTEREWPTEDDTAINALGHALVQACATEPDTQNATDIMASIVHEVALGVRTRTQSLSTTDLVDPRLRTGLATIVVPHIGSVHNAYQDFTATDIDWDPYLPGNQKTVPAPLGPMETTRFLAEIGKDTSAHTTMLEAASAYASNAYRQALLDHRKTSNISLLKKFTSSFTPTLTAINYSYDRNVARESLMEMKRRKESFDTEIAMKQERLAFEEQGGHYIVELLTMEAIRIAPEGSFPRGVLKRDGVPIPMKDWAEAQHNAWSDYGLTYDDGIINSMYFRIDQSLEASYLFTRKVLEGSEDFLWGRSILQ
jgi:hypothetical protein